MKMPKETVNSGNESLRKEKENIWKMGRWEENVREETKRKP
jgi:hypothetical protein